MVIALGAIGLGVIATWGFMLGLCRAAGKPTPTPPGMTDAEREAATRYKALDEIMASGHSGLSDPRRASRTDPGATWEPIFGLRCRCITPRSSATCPIHPLKSSHSHAALIRQQIDQTLARSGAETL